MAVPRPPSKIFNDPIHGHIELSGLSVRIIDTPQFQRLRDVSQLGGVYYVFPGAASRRFEHSLGVAHLARQFVDALRSKQADLDITDADALCLEIAGLCHDLGHGPFSHLYDGRFLPIINHSHEFAHEHASIGIFDYMIRANNLMSMFNLFGLGEGDVQFIKELMLGDKNEGPPGFEWKGRGRKTYLYDIVANKRNGIDVDKFDYFARDCHVLGLTKSFDASRLMRFAKVFRVSRDNMGNGTSGRSLLNDDIDISGEMNGSQKLVRTDSVGTNTSASSSAGSLDGSKGLIPLEICFHVKEAWNLFELFHTRYALHKRAYQHRVGAAVELMLLEAMLLADPYLLFSGTDGKLRRMSECPHDMAAYWKLSDAVLKQIETSYSEELAPARAMVHRLRTRDLFAFSGEIILSAERRAQLKLGGFGATEKIKKELVALLPQHLHRQGSPALAECKTTDPAAGASSTDETICENDIFCEIVKMSYGKGAKNPVSGPTAFYEPKKPTAGAHGSGSTEDEVGEAKALESMDPEHRLQDKEMKEQNLHWSVGVVPQDAVSRVTPREFEETYIRVYCRFRSQKDILKDVFQQWCQMNRVCQPITPMKRARTEE